MLQEVGGEAGDAGRYDEALGIRGAHGPRGGEGHAGVLFRIRPRRPEAVRLVPQLPDHSATSEARRGSRAETRVRVPAFG